MKRDDIYLRHILDAIQIIEEYIKDVSEEKFLESRFIQDAVIRELEIIGEAAKQVSDSVRVVKKDLPELKKNLITLLPQ